MWWKKVSPNLITSVRIPAAFSIVLLLCTDLKQWDERLTQEVGMILAFAVMVIAWLTDWADGAVARSKYGEVTEFGKWFDPVCDSIFHLLAFLAFFLNGWMPLLFLVIVAIRETESYAYRILMWLYGLELGARRSGKQKTVIYVVVQLSVVLAYIAFPYAGMSYRTIWWITLPIFASTVGVATWSGMDYACHGHREVQKARREWWVL